MVQSGQSVILMVVKKQGVICRLHLPLK